MADPHVYIVIVNYREWQDCLECILSVLRSTYQGYSIFVVDNNSGNQSLGHLANGLRETLASGRTAYSPGSAIALMSRSQFEAVDDICSLPQLIFIQNDRNAGFASANNIVLAKLASVEGYFWLLNPDMVVTPATLSGLISGSLQLPVKSIMGARVLSYAGNQRLLFYGGAKVNFTAATVKKLSRATSVSELDYISGGCLFCDNSNLQRLGLLPEEYFLYWEETDWCYSAKIIGYGLHVCNTAICYDKGSTSVGKSFVADYYYARNGLLFISRFRPANIPLVMFFLGARFLIRVFTGRLQRARGIFRGTLDYLKMKPYESK